MIRLTIVLIAGGSLLGVAAAAPSGVEIPSAYLSAAPWSRGAALMGDLSAARYDGRRLFQRSAELAFAPTERLAFWLGETDVVAHGRASGSRLRVHSDRQTLRYRMGTRKGFDFAGQLDRFGTTDAVATTDSGPTTSRDVYAGTRGYGVGMIATRGPLDLALRVSYVDTRVEDARTLSATAGYHLPVARNLTLWGQGTLTATDADGGVKPTLRGQLRYVPTPWSALALEGVAYLRGLPADDPLGSFLVYRPGGSAAAGLRSGVLGFGAVCLTFGIRF